MPITPAQARALDYLPGDGSWVRAGPKWRMLRALKAVQPGWLEVGGLSRVAGEWRLTEAGMAAKAGQEDWQSDYRDYGTVEGDLEAIQDRNGLQIRVRDQILRTSILCLVPEEMLKEAFDNFRKRVEISGLIHYRRNGTPISIGVDRIERLPDDSDLPSLNDVRGILRRNPGRESAP